MATTNRATALASTTTHPLVTPLRFTRREWIRGLKVVTAGEAKRRFGAIDPIAWMIGDLAWQEQFAAARVRRRVRDVAVPAGALKATEGRGGRIR